MTVPGNHDLYLDDAVTEQRFERVFGDLLASDWAPSVGGLFPAVRLYRGPPRGDHHQQRAAQSPAVSLERARFPQRNCTRWRRCCAIRDWRGARS